MSLRYINNNGEEIAIAGQGLPGRDGEGIHVGTVLAYNGLDIPDGYEQVEDPIAALRREIYEAMWPIGRGFIDFTDTDYSNYLGLTWERELVGMTPIGLDTTQTEFNAIGKTGGEKTHTLTKAELPNYTLYNASHNHGQNINGNGDDGWNNSYGPAITKPVTGGTGSSGRAYADNGETWSNNANRVKTDSVTITVNSGGSGTAMNNLQPYQVVSYWKRVDPNAKKMISFTVSSVSYQAEEGMTWAEWCDSEYNTNGFYTSGNLVYRDGTYLSSVTASSVIENGAAYYYSKEK